MAPFIVARRRRLLALVVAVLGVASAASGAKLPPLTRDALARDPPRGANPYLAWLPAAAAPDWIRWRALLRLEGAERRALRAERRALHATGAPPSPFVESEPSAIAGRNDLPSFAEPVPGFGTLASQQPTAVLRGELLPLPTLLAPAAEPDGAIPLARALPLVEAEDLAVDGTVGDGDFGSGTASPAGDFDFFSVALAPGQELRVQVRTPEPLAGLDPIVGLFDAGGGLVASNDDLSQSGFLTQQDSYLAWLSPASGTFYLAVGGAGGPFSQAQFPADPFDPASGPGAGSEGTYTLVVSLGTAPGPDRDLWGIELRAGDVVGATVTGGARRLSLLGPAGDLRVSSPGLDLSALYGDGSPLPGGGAATLAFVADADGTWYLGVESPPLLGGGSYEIEAAAYRPPLDRSAEPGWQVLYLDFDGAVVDPSAFGGPPGSATLSPLTSFLPHWGLPSRAADAVIDAVLAEVTARLSSDARQHGGNGDFAASGRPGEFAIEIRNSRDHADPGPDGRVTRLVVGGSVDELGLETVGIAESIDPGNFATGETAVVLLDLLSGPDYEPVSLNGVPRVTPMTQLVGTALGRLAAHEAGHLFANFHTARDLGTPTVMDRGGDLRALLGVGADGVFGSEDDAPVQLADDLYEPAEGFSGTENTLRAVAFDLPAAGARAELAVTPAAVAFGAVAIGDVATVELRASNEGQLPLAVSAVQLAGAGELSADPAAFSLAAGAVHAIPVHFAPTAVGPRAAALTLVSPDGGDRTVPLTGGGGRGDLALSPPLLDLGVVDRLAPAPAPSDNVVVANLGPDALAVDGLTLVGPGAAAWSLVAPPLPWVLAAGEERTVVVTFAPPGPPGLLPALLLVSSDDPDGSPAAVELRGRHAAPDLAVSPPSPYFFGTPPPGGSRFRHFQLTNVGLRPLQVSAATLSGPDVDAFSFAGPLPPFTLDPGVTGEVAVFFRPTRAGDHEALLRLANDDPDGDPYLIELFGIGGVGEVAVWPPRLDFPDVGPPAVVTRQLELHNVGWATLRVSGLEITGRDAGEFSLPGGGGPRTISFRSRQLVAVSFQPAMPGEKRAVLRIASDDADTPLLEVPLVAGAPSGPAAEIPAAGPLALALLTLTIAVLGLRRLR